MPMTSAWSRGDALLMWTTWSATMLPSATRRWPPSPAPCAPAGAGQGIGDLDLHQLHGVLDEQRQQRGLTRAALAGSLDGPPAGLTDLRTARRADTDLVLRVTQWRGAPAARFVHPAPR